MNRQQALAVAASAWNRYEALLHATESQPWNRATTPNEVAQLDQIEVCTRMEWYSNLPQEDVFYNKREVLAAAVELRRSWKPSLTAEAQS